MKKHTFYSLIIFICCGSVALADSYQAIILPSGGYERVTAAALSLGTTAGPAIFTESPPSIVMPFRRNALVWQTPASSPQNIHPAECYGSYINASYGQTLGGAVTIADTQESQFPPYTRTFQYNQAAIWTGPAHDFVNLHPAGYDQSVVTACWGNQQAGYVQTNSAADPLLLSVSNAALWSGTAESVVNLHPDGFARSTATGIWENQQVGSGFTEQPVLPGPIPPPDLSQPAQERALLWHGTAESVIDLHPDAFISSRANDVWNNQQVGSASVNSDLILSVSHAVLWYGSAETCVDLHPDGFLYSEAYAVCNGQQVGSGHLDFSLNSGHALLWSGTAESVTDLHLLLPEIYVSSSASDIDEFGNIVGTATLADGTSHAVIWQPIPEPATLLLLAAGVYFMKPQKNRNSTPSQ